MKGFNRKNRIEDRAYLAARPEKRPTGRVFVVSQKRILICLTAVLVLFATCLSVGLGSYFAEEKKSRTGYVWTAVSDLSELTESTGAAGGEALRVMITWGDTYYISGAKAEGRWYGRKMFLSDSTAVGSETVFFTDNGRGTPFLKIDAADGVGSEGLAASILLGQTLVENGKSVEKNTGLFLGMSADGGLEAQKKQSGQWMIKPLSQDGKGRLFVQLVLQAEDGSLRYLVPDEGGLILSEEPDAGDDLFGDEEEGSAQEGQKGVVLYLAETESIQTLSAQDGLDEDAYGEITKKSILPASQILTIEKNATLALEDTLILEGNIEVRGGTLLIREGGMLMSGMSADENDLTSRIQVFDGGAVVVEPLGRLYLGGNGRAHSDAIDGQITLTSGGKLYNFGTTVLGRLVCEEGRVENRNKSLLYLGYQFSKRGWNRFYLQQSDRQPKPWTAAGCRMGIEGFGRTMVSSVSSQPLLPAREKLCFVNEGNLWLGSGIAADFGLDALIDGNRPCHTKKLVITNNVDRVITPFETGFGTELMQSAEDFAAEQIREEAMQGSVSGNTTDYDPEAADADTQDSPEPFDPADPFANDFGSFNGGFTSGESDSDNFTIRTTDDEDDEEWEEDDEEEDDWDDEDDEDDDDEDEDDEDEDDEEDDRELIPAPEDDGQIGGVLLP
ncbi:MAG: hypothetical protein K6E18_00560 [Lachnospiraceae bacterium]|nr:hypothetical protein [Lachnospiraceae bacterium]